MRAVCFVKRLQWDVPGTLLRHGLAIGDVDNDGDSELVAGTAEGDLYIFKGSELWQRTGGLGLVTCVAVGDVFNCGRNALVVVSGDGWVYIYYSPRTLQSEGSHDGRMECVHTQRIPTNTKVALVADVDRDGANELVIGLTDRVVRSYRWCGHADLGTGRLVGLNKWECANQVGTVTLQHDADGAPTLLVGQPGGTFMRIRCNAEDGRAADDEPGLLDSEAAVDYQTLGISRMRNPNISTEILGNLTPRLAGGPRPGDGGARFVKAADGLYSSPLSSARSGLDAVDGNLLGGGVVYGEYEAAAAGKDGGLEFRSAAKQPPRLDSREESADGLPGGAKEASKAWSSGKSYALATLDGTIMLVKDEVILWSMQVDHHISGLCALDVTGDAADEIVACTWDGQTYILDQQRNSVRFQFEEPVRAFCAGRYSLAPRAPAPCLVYNNFAGKLFLYHDVRLPSLLLSALQPEEALPRPGRRLLRGLLRGDEARLGPLTRWLLYGRAPAPPS